jgi:hypothetical protein
MFTTIELCSEMSIKNVIFNEGDKNCFQRLGQEGNEMAKQRPLLIQSYMNFDIYIYIKAPD